MTSKCQQFSRTTNQWRCQFSANQIKRNNHWRQSSVLRSSSSKSESTNPEVELKIQNIQHPIQIINHHRHNIKTTTRSRTPKLNKLPTLPLFKVQHKELGDVLSAREDCLARRISSRCTILMLARWTVDRRVMGDDVWSDSAPAAQMILLQVGQTIRRGSHLCIWTMIGSQCLLSSSIEALEIMAGLFLIRRRRLRDDWLLMPTIQPRLPYPAILSAVLFSRPPACIRSDHTISARFYWWVTM